MAVLQCILFIFCIFVLYNNLLINQVTAQIYFDNLTCGLFFR